MTSHRRRTWGWFVAIAALLVAVMVWLTGTISALDRDELAARRQAQQQEKLRLALWRMDSWLSPQLAREALRPAEDYRALALSTSASRPKYQSDPHGLEQGRPVTPPTPQDPAARFALFGAVGGLFQLHFEVDPQGVLSSPQVPSGEHRAAAVRLGVSDEAIDAAAARLAALGPRLQVTALLRRLRAAEAALPSPGVGVAPGVAGPVAGADPGTDVQLAQSAQEYANRALSNSFNQNMLPVREGGSGASGAAAASVGPMLPLWLDGAGEPLLVLARRVAMPAGQGPPGMQGLPGMQGVQGVLLDWTRLQQELVGLIADLLVGGSAALVRCEAPAVEQQGSMLATVPARLVVTPAPLPVTSALPTNTILVITWGMTLLALVVLGFTLRTAIRYGERRARFASAVTHELRTPLTTFRLYTELLADGVVADQEARQQYLVTLRQESDRLARVVENVLAWSRLEEGRFTGRLERRAVGALLQRQVPQLARRLDDVGVSLELDVGDRAGGAVLVTDEDAVGQILFNLVDNAAKYSARRAAGESAAEATESDAITVTLGAALDGAQVRISVRDHGPGVPAAHRATIFAPFDRGAVPTASNDIPGVGLGLALARGLARDLGGDLSLDPTVTDGARFVLSLPVA